MRAVFFWVVPVIAATACGASGGAVVRTQANGAWAGCGNVTRPAAFHFRRIEELPQAGLLGPVSAIQRRAPLVRMLYRDVCVLMAHPNHWPKGVAVNCPADLGLVYRGVFYAGTRRLAVMTYRPTGCPSLGVSVGSARSDYGIFSKGAAAAAARFGPDFAAVLGIRANSHEWWP